MHAHAPEVAPARSWARFPIHWCHGIVRHLEGSAVSESHRSRRSIGGKLRFKPVDTSEVAQAALST
jgi:hypothetical protein